MGRAKRHSAQSHGAAVSIDSAVLRAQFRALRARLGLSQADAAALAGISQATISAFEHGRHLAAHPSTLLKLRALVMRCEPEGATPAKNRHTTRTLLDRSNGDLGRPCVWCSAELPRAIRPQCFCPCCGGHQTRACACGAPCFDGWAKFCGRCGREIDGAPARIDSSPDTAPTPERESAPEAPS